MEDKPIKGLDFKIVTEGDTPVSPIPRKRKSDPITQNGLANGTVPTNGNANGNGVQEVQATPKKKRAASEDLEGPLLTKRPKVPIKAALVKADDDLIVVGDDGAIVIED